MSSNIPAIFFTFNSAAFEIVLVWITTASATRAWYAPHGSTVTFRSRPLSSS